MSAIKKPAALSFSEHTSRLQANFDFWIEKTHERTGSVCREDKMLHGLAICIMCMKKNAFNILINAKIKIIFIVC